MKITVVTVLYKTNWRTVVADLTSRLGLMDEVLGRSRTAHMVALPAGFFQVPSETEIPSLLRRIDTILNQHSPAVLWGIDVSNPEKECTKQETVAGARTLPMFVCLRLTD